MPRSLPVVLALASLLVGCGHSPTAPGPSAVTITSADDLVFIGADAPLTATADGRDVTATSEWTVEGTALHIVSPGIVHADHSGSAHVWAKYQGVQGQIVLRALPNMAGHFVGQYVVDSCSEVGSVTGGYFCQPPGYSIGSAWPLSMILTQARDVVSGTVSVGTVTSAPFDAPVSTSGSVALALNASASGVSLSEGFSITSELPGRIDGTMTLVLSSDRGVGRVEAHLLSVTRQ
jgi:hypothetical protein